MRKRHLVLSAVNLTEGGTLTILRNCLAAAKNLLLPEWRITVLVHDAALIDGEDIDVLVFPEIKLKWSRRLFFEWFNLRKISKNLNADLWFSLHDISPVVYAHRRVVYCHNPSPFYKLRIQDCLYSPTLVAMRLFYARLYGINIKSNDFVIVQQEWLRSAFECRYGINNVIVAYPYINSSSCVRGRDTKNDNIYRFFFPTLPRPFKNIDILLAASALLWKRGIRNFEVNITVDKQENAYIRNLSSRYSELSCIQYLGRISFADVEACYLKADALLFPSKLETWGLPISEAKSFGLPIICSDLPYAYETVGNYDNVRFCSPNSAEQWAEQMLSIIASNWKPSNAKRISPTGMFYDDWTSLLSRLTFDL